MESSFYHGLKLANNQLYTTTEREEKKLQDENSEVRANVSWQHYQSLLATFQEQAGLKLIYYYEYYETLELLMPSAEHERIKKAIARLLEHYAEEIDIILHGYGSTTFRKEAKASGLEPDECYCIDTWKDIPDFAIEVNLSSGQIDKLKVYQNLGVPEMLIWQKKFVSY